MFSFFVHHLQADACHAYQIMKKHGIPEARIITMMYDDIANSDEYVRDRSISSSSLVGWSQCIDEPFP